VAGAQAAIGWITLDLAGSYRSVADTMLPDANQVADPFHVVRVANERLDEVRRRVQNETLGHRGRKNNPLYYADLRVMPNLGRRRSLPGV
jgi:transposase